MDIAKELILLNGEICLVDDDLYDYFNQWKWHLSNGYVVRRDKDTNGKLITVILHREVVDAKKGDVVDHIDGDKLNNIRINLRICTHAENMRNRRNKAKSSSKYKGVSWQENMNLWESSITYNRKNLHLGYFNNEISAANFYNLKAKELFGEFACLNDVEYQSYEECLKHKFNKKTYSKYIGVTWNKNYGKYRAGIKKGEKSIHLGYYDNEIVAAQVYNKKAVELFGNSAKLNDVPDISDDEYEKHISKIRKKTSNYIGVKYDKHCKVWYARIYINGKDRYIGRFNNEIEAAKAYNKYIIENELNKKLNVIEGDEDRG